MRELKRRSAAAAGAAPAPAAADVNSDVPYIETLTQIFEVVASAYLQQEQLAIFIGGSTTAASALQAAHHAAVNQELAVIDAFVEDFNVAKRAQTLRSKQVPDIRSVTDASVPVCNAAMQGSTFDARKIDALTDDIAFILQVM